jgi:CheY-like chemotaxis protein
VERHETIDCVILDLTMPKMDGQAAFQEIRRLRPRVPVILSSGYNEQEVTQKFVGKAFTTFVQKPYQLLELATRMQEALTPKVPEGF